MRTNPEKQFPSNNRSETSKVERFLTSIYFKAIGLLLVVVGLFYLIVSTSNLNWLKNLTLSLYAPSEDVLIPSTDGHFGMLLAFFLPVSIILGLTAIFFKKLNRYSLWLIIGSIVYLSVIQTIIFVYYPLLVYVGGLYPSLSIVNLFLLSTLILLFINS